MISSFLNKIIDERVDQRIHEVINNDCLFAFRKINNDDAKKEISTFILNNKSNNITQLSTIDFVLNLKLPADQIEEILEQYKKEDKLKEINA
jgi:hypothetical protein